jgi:hypothetical protein
VLSGGAAEPEESDPPEPADPEADDPRGSIELEPEEPDELEPVPELVLDPWLAVACFAPSAGSWPVTSVAKMTAHVARNSATASATTVRRIFRVRARRAARRGCGVASDMGTRLRGQAKPRLSAA